MKSKKRLKRLHCSLQFCFYRTFDFRAGHDVDCVTLQGESSPLNTDPEETILTFFTLPSGCFHTIRSLVFEDNLHQMLLI